MEDHAQICGGSIRLQILTSNSSARPRQVSRVNGKPAKMMPDSMHTRSTRILQVPCQGDTEFVWSWIHFLAISKPCCIDMVVFINALINLLVIKGYFN